MQKGKTRIRKRFVVSAPVAGRLERIQLDEGDKVTQGAVVARIDPLSLDARVRETQAKLREWQAEKAGVATQRPKQSQPYTKPKPKLEQQKQHIGKPR